MPPEWKRLAAIHVNEMGEIGAVWFAYDTNTDVLHLYDCCVFKPEVLAVIAEGLNARGRWIPVAWMEKAKEMADNLLDRGCNMVYEPVKDSSALFEVISRDISERMKTGRFKVDKRLSEWKDEFKTFYKDESRRERHPLMLATHYAVERLDYAKRQAPARKSANYPKIAVL